MTLIRAAFVAIFILAILSGSSVYAADTCQGVFRSSGPLVDGRFGRASQLDPYLEAQGLFGTNGSQLCGPACIFNGIAKFHAVDGRLLDAEAPRRVADLVRRFFAITGDDVVKNGSKPQHIVQVMRAALSDEHIEATVNQYASNESSSAENHIVGRPSLELMHEAIRDDTIIIAQIGRYDVDNAYDASDNRRTSGHFVLIVGYDPAAPSRIYVVDPMSPRQLRIIELSKVYPERFPSHAYQVRFIDGHVGQRLQLVENLVVVKRHH